MSKVIWQRPTLPSRSHFCNITFTHLVTLTLVMRSFTMVAGQANSVQCTHPELTLQCAGTCLPFSCGIWALSDTTFLGWHKSAFKWYFDWFSCFCTAHLCASAESTPCATCVVKGPHQLTSYRRCGYKRMVTIRICRLHRPTYIDFVGHFLIEPGLAEIAGSFLFFLLLVSQKREHLAFGISCVNFYRLDVLLVIQPTLIKVLKKTWKHLLISTSVCLIFSSSTTRLLAK